MTAGVGGEQLLSEACPVCGRALDPTAPRNINVRLRPTTAGALVSFTAHWTCLAPLFDRVVAEEGESDVYPSLFGR